MAVKFYNATKTENMIAYGVMFLGMHTTANYTENVWDRLLAIALFVMFGATWLLKRERDTE